MSRPPDRPLRWGFLGSVPYREAVERQEELRRQIRLEAAPDSLLLLEHPHVYTLGRSASRRDVLTPSAELAGRGVAIEECDRGGQVTYHGPGQLVGYPVLDLNPDRRDVRRYVRDLQAVLVETLARLGVAAEGRMEQPLIGVWAEGRKIGSIGVHLSRWITTHGFALNVTTDLDYFRGIVPCGLERVEMTSVERETGRRHEPAAVAALCAEVFARVFERRPVRLDPLAAGRLGVRPPGALPRPASREAAWAGRS